ncbi:MAG: CopG family transcriptional regulator [Pseudohongiellaceae bacterium]
MRTIVDLPEEQVEALKHMSEQSKLSRAALMRQAVAEFLLHHQAGVAGEAFGIWKNQQRDGLEYQRRLREEWPA